MSWFFSTSHRRSQKRSTDLLPQFRLCRSSSSALRVGYAIDDIDRDARKVVSDFGGSIRSLDLYHVRNKRTSKIKRGTQGCSTPRVRLTGRGAGACF